MDCNITMTLQEMHCCCCGLGVGGGGGGGGGQSDFIYSQGRPREVKKWLLKTGDPLIQVHLH